MEEKSVKKKFTMPNTFVVISIFIMIATVLTWIIPSGTFDRAFDEATGRTLVVPGTFKLVAHTPVSLPQMVMSIYDGMVDAANIVFFTFFSYGFMVMLIRVGAFDAGVGALIRRLKDKKQFAMPLIAIIFSLMGASFGIYEESYGFVPVVMSMGVALGYDPFYGAIAVLGGIATGYAAASINPYTVAIAQTIGELPLFSGMGFRWLCYVCFMTLFLSCMCRYGRMVKADPKKSYVYGVEFPFLSSSTQDELVSKEFTTRHKISLLICLGTVIAFAFGAIRYGWYFSELSAIFIVMMFVVGLVNKQSINETCDAFVDISKNILFAAFVIGLSRAILIVLQKGQIIDTICFYFSNGLAGMSKTVAAEAMFGFQTLLNLFIPSGSGQAVTSMPLMIPLSDLLKINRQIAVLAFQFGDGFSNIFWPTACAVLCAISGVPINKWWKFFAPYCLFATILGAALIAAAVSINYGPF
ncbi:YfcC family protein [Synergistes jonesii]|uniref:C4-dicarboxylate ABC transporter n=1 Tax=Synergistes jonesii TaxID=2754 RepID=A0A073ISG7_9BACT|nr:TIGR00366 family protein [Synergistes jonesii]KEJ93288.1 C4-dicarboxylate ABC transporter [Synergistes jonesii]OFB63293.1 C4-dicarboxylate ABC transporter [Synergistes jonesii]OFB64872.1 C4-dicarboxylate ABC transporter [Synergistes jonesii]OFB66272.1 C4-dicarboxylate ABC transporter [Synergistes jonesii]OFB69039.1 C4-dicarboxylate ABC transporter [Synergistes jonesii]